MDRSYFIYIHYRNDNGKPFYVGRGKHKKEAKSNRVFYGRAHSKRGRTAWWSRVVNKVGHTVEIAVDNLSFQESLDKEVELISLYGRYTDGGLLCNVFIGGEHGALGYKQTPEAIRKMKDRAKDLKYYIDKHVNYEPNSGCWLWSGQFSDGFPKVSYGGKDGLQASRAIYEHIKGVKLKAKVQVLHNTCKQEHCVNPDHFIVGSSVLPENQYRILTKEQVTEIRRLANEGHFIHEIADLIGASNNAISSILTGKSWKWFNPEENPNKLPNYKGNKPKAILCVDTGKIYNSAREAAQDTIENTPTVRRGIRAACAGKTKGLYRGLKFSFING